MAELFSTHMQSFPLEDMSDSGSSSDGSSSDCSASPKAVSAAAPRAAPTSSSVGKAVRDDARDSVQWPRFTMGSSPPAVSPKWHHHSTRRDSGANWSLRSGSCSDSRRGSLGAKPDAAAATASSQPTAAVEVVTNVYDSGHVAVRPAPEPQTCQQAAPSSPSGSDGKPLSARKRGLQYWAENLQILKDRTLARTTKAFRRTASRSLSHAPSNIADRDVPDRAQFLDSSPGGNSSPVALTATPAPDPRPVSAVDVPAGLSPQESLDQNAPDAMTDTPQQEMSGHHPDSPVRLRAHPPDGLSSSCSGYHCTPGTHPAPPSSPPSAVTPRSSFARSSTAGEASSRRGSVAPRNARDTPPYSSPPLATRGRATAASSRPPQVKKLQLSVITTQLHEAADTPGDNNRTPQAAATDRQANVAAQLQAGQAWLDDSTCSSPSLTSAQPTPHSAAGSTHGASVDSSPRNGGSGRGGSSRKHSQHPLRSPLSCNKGPSSPIAATKTPSQPAAVRGRAVVAVGSGQARPKPDGRSPRSRHPYTPVHTYTSVRRLLSAVDDALASPAKPASARRDNLRLQQRPAHLHPAFRGMDEEGDADSLLRRVTDTALNSDEDGPEGVHHGSASGAETPPEEVVRSGRAAPLPSPVKFLPGDSFSSLSPRVTDMATRRLATTGKLLVEASASVSQLKHRQQSDDIMHVSPPPQPSHKSSITSTRVHPEEIRKSSQRSPRSPDGKSNLPPLVSLRLAPQAPSPQQNNRYSNNNSSGTPASGNVGTTASSMRKSSLSATPPHSTSLRSLQQQQGQEPGHFVIGTRVSASPAQLGDLLQVASPNDIQLEVLQKLPGEISTPRPRAFTPGDGAATPANAAEALPSALSTEHGSKLCNNPVLAALSIMASANDFPWLSRGHGLLTPVSSGTTRGSAPPINHAAAYAQSHGSSQGSGDGKATLMLVPRGGDDVAKWSSNGDSAYHADDVLFDGPMEPPDVDDSELIELFKTFSPHASTPAGKWGDGKGRTGFPAAAGRHTNGAAKGAARAKSLLRRLFGAGRPAQQASGEVAAVEQGMPAEEDLRVCAPTRKTLRRHNQLMMEQLHGPSPGALRRLLGGCFGGAGSLVAPRDWW